MGIKILAFNGSLRAGSWNYKMVEIAGRIAERAGAEVSYLHLKDLPMPLFSEDLETEHGMHPNARKFKELLISHNALLIASPEYNSSIPAALKNMIDWASRREADEPRLLAFKDKVATIISASPGKLGGLRGLVHLRAILGNLGVVVLPRQYAMSQADKQFDQEGRLLDEYLHKEIAACVHPLIEICRKLYPE
jgi:NAD(P)H-dependent FMN reductase